MTERYYTHPYLEGTEREEEEYIPLRQVGTEFEHTFPAELSDKSLPSSSDLCALHGHTWKYRITGHVAAFSGGHVFFRNKLEAISRTCLGPLWTLTGGIYSDF